MRDVTNHPNTGLSDLREIMAQAVKDFQESLTRLGFLYSERARIEIQSFENSEQTSIAARQREAEIAARPVIEETYKYEALRDAYKAEIELIQWLTK